MTEEGRQVRDIFDITGTPQALAEFARTMHDNHGEISLVAGGPPCQGYSGIGHRRTFDIAKESIPSNHLYREMAKVIEAVAPRAFLFENVRGLLNSRWTPGGEKGEIWNDVYRTFQQITVEVNGVPLMYKVDWDLILAKDYGVPQNRPRVFIVGIREDLEGIELDGSLPASGLLPRPIEASPPNLVDLLDDLVDENWHPGGATTAYLTHPKSPVQRLLRTLPTGRVLRKGAELTEQQYSNHSERVLTRFEHILNGEEIPLNLQTKKFAQRLMPRVWDESGPNLTATSLADDYVHFSQPRAPTVREMARIQTFPDWYEFSGPRSTGGRRRAGDPSLGIWDRDVPKFTQIGNAVPVWLASAVGKHLKELLDHDSGSE